MRKEWTSVCKLLTAVFFVYLPVPEALAGSQISGYIYDLSGNPLSQAMVSVNTGEHRQGADVVTVFTDAEGQFHFPETVSGITNPEQQVSTRVPGFEQTRVTAAALNGALKLTVMMRRTANYANSAPASAWLANINAVDKENLVMSCIGCHQVPGPEVRAYAKQIADVTSSDPAAVRKESWAAIIKYMNYMQAEEFRRASSSAPPDPKGGYAVGNRDEVVGILASNFAGPLQVLDHFDFGAPLAVTADTVIGEYAVALPNTVREAVIVGTPPKLWASDVSSNRMIAIDIATGKQEIHEVPTDKVMGPHTLVRGPDGSLWITPLFETAVLAHLDPNKLTWQTWPLKTQKGELSLIHDLSFGYKHELLTDKKGRIWFSDIGNNAVGYIDPKTGVVENFKTPAVEGRTAMRARLYGLVMTSDQKHIWYSQVGIGSFGSFNVETLKFEKSVVLPSAKSGPRRLTITDQDIMYVPLYGAGQLIEYDTRAGKQIGIYDLPDRACAPYSVTWDPKRKVVWVATSNADVIYRFDPASKKFSVLPLPRAGAFLRMVDVDPSTGVLTTTYANIVENVHGPRMALTIDPGDHVYDKNKGLASR